MRGTVVFSFATFTTVGNIYKNIVQETIIFVNLLENLKFYT